MMENYDDLFAATEQTQQGYAPAADFDKDAWTAKKQAERTAAYDLIDLTAETLGQDEGLFKTYLDVQSRMGLYSVANALLITAQRPDATRLGGFEDWKKQGGYPKKDEKAIVILEPGKEYAREDGSTGQSFNAKKVFDISQTTVKAKPQPAIHHDDRTLIKALIRDCPVPIRAVEELSDPQAGAQFSPEQQAIFVKQGLDGPALFRAIATALAHAEFAAGDRAYECDAHNEFKAESVAYMLCKRSGIDTAGFDFCDTPVQFENLDTKAIRAELAQTREVANDISTRMSLELDVAKNPRQQAHER